MALALSLAYVARIGYAAFRQGQDAADYSCLASIHSELISLHLVGSGATNAEWREWEASEAAGAFTLLQASDCGNQRRWCLRMDGVKPRWRWRVAWKSLRGAMPLTATRTAALLSPCVPATR